MSPSLPRTTFVARTILWIVISSGLLLWNLQRLHTFRSLGLPITGWAWSQIALWTVALIFWLYTGWRDWTRRPR